MSTRGLLVIKDRHYNDAAVLQIRHGEPNIFGEELVKYLSGEKFTIDGFLCRPNDRRADAAYHYYITPKGYWHDVIVMGSNDLEDWAILFEGSCREFANWIQELVEERKREIQNRQSGIQDEESPF